MVGRDRTITYLKFAEMVRSRALYRERKRTQKLRLPEGEMDIIKALQKVRRAFELYVILETAKIEDAREKEAEGAWEEALKIWNDWKEDYGDYGGITKIYPEPISDADWPMVGQRVLDWVSTVWLR